MNHNVTRRVAIRAAASAQCRRWASSNSPRKLGPKPKAKAPPSTLLYKPTSEAPPRARAQAAPPPPPRREADTLLAVWRSAWLPLSGAALAAGAIGFYIFGTAAATFKSGRPCTCEDDREAPTGRPPALTGDNAEQFDKELNWPEWWMGITSLRRRLAEHARGDVLELAMGSGRNLEYYDWSPITDALEAAAAAAAAAAADDTTAMTTAKKKTTKTAKAQCGITSFTGLDISVDMLDVARKKLTRTVPPLRSSAPIVSASSMADNTGGQLAFLEGRLRLVHSDAHHALPPAPSFSRPLTSSSSSSSSSTATTMTTAAAKNNAGSSNNDANKKYDSIIQTFGLCSVSDPVAVLTNLASAVKPGTGRIVLLEHGKGFYGLVNGLLDKNAGKHFDKYGCWWNRDIEALVEEAARQAPGLSIVKVERPKILQMGTLVWVELKVDETPGTLKK